uniref:NET domain-containing protein n=1 Tax=viral metagenome TaxID=1070528 RepID=A0A6C0F8B2_9ZZZZ
MESISISSISEENCNNVEEFDTEDLISLRDTIEHMSKFNQVEILRILKQHDESVTLNENKYGIHINLSELKKEIIADLKTYIKYVNAQEDNLNEVEKQKESFKNIYFTKDNKDNKEKDTRSSKHVSTTA